MWRTLGYQTYPSSYPSVYQVKVKMPVNVQDLLTEGKLCDLAVYFGRPTQLLHFKYADFFNAYIWSYKKPTRIQNNVCYEIRIHGINKPVFIYKRDPRHKSITRIGMLYPTAGEIWYVRLLLMHRSCISFKDLRTINAIEYSTFQEAAIAYGLVEDQNEVVRCFEDILHISSPAEKRGLFMLLTVQVIHFKISNVSRHIFAN